MGMICSWYVNGKLLKTKTYPDLKAFHGHAVHWRLLRSRTFPLGPLMAWQSFKSANLQKLPYRQSRKHFPKLRRPPKYRIMSLCSFSNLDFVATSFCVSKRLLKPDQTKKKLRKFLDAMIQKSGKIRCLVREINDSYSKSDLLQKWHPQSRFHRYI